MADFNFGRAFSEGSSAMGSLLLQKRAQDEQSRQFNISSAQSGRELDLRERMAEPAIEAAETDNEQKRAAILSQGQGGKAFLDLIDLYNDEPTQFLDNDAEGNPIEGVIGPKTSAQQVLKMSVKHGLDAQGVDVLIGLLDKTLNTDAKWIKNTRDLVKTEVEKHAGKEVKKALTEVMKDLEAKAPKAELQADFDALAAAQSTLTGQKLTQAETQLSAESAREAAAAQAEASKPVSKVAELNNLIKTFEEAGEADPVTAAVDRMYGSDLAQMLKAYGDVALFMPDNPAVQGLGQAIVDKTRSITGRAKKDKKTPSGVKWNKQNFPSLITLSDQGWLDQPTGIQDFINAKWTEIGSDLEEAGVTIEEYTKWVYDEYMKELTRGGWLTGGGK